MDTYEYIVRNNNGTFKKLDARIKSNRRRMFGSLVDKNTTDAVDWTIDQTMDDFDKEWKARHNGNK